MDRREFLKLAAAGAVALPAGWSLVRPGEAQASSGGGAPATGKRWSMVVDLRKDCPVGCRDCITACNVTHNVPSFSEKRHEIKWIWQAPFYSAFLGVEQQHGREDLERREVTVLCNHCEKPPCVRVCPTQATYRRPDGIVMMDFHRCIGCRFCMAGCPYGSRSFNWGDPRAGLPAKVPNPAYPTRMKGVVEKCTFCSELIDKGLAPACVDACREKMLAFGDLNDAASPVRGLLKEHFTIRRKPNLGTDPQVYYIIGG